MFCRRSPESNNAVTRVKIAHFVHSCLLSSNVAYTAVRWLIWLSSKLSIQEHLFCFIHCLNSWQDEAFWGSTISSHSTKALVTVTSIGERPCYEQSDAICRALVIDATHTVCIGHNNAVTRVKIAHFVHSCLLSSNVAYTAVRWLIWLSSKLSIQEHLFCFIHCLNSWQDEAFWGSTISSHSTKALVTVTSIGERPCYEQSDAICRALIIDATHTVCIGHNNAVKRVKIAHLVHSRFVVQYTVTSVLSQSFKVLLLFWQAINQCSHIIAFILEEIWFRCLSQGCVFIKERSDEWVDNGKWEMSRKSVPFIALHIPWHCGRHAQHTIALFR